MELTIIAVAAVVAIVAVAAVSQRIAVAAPLSMVVVGIALSFLPGLPEIEVNPEWILAGALPPLLYATAVHVPAQDFRRDFKAIAGLAVPLVVLTTVCAGPLVAVLRRDADRAAAARPELEKMHRRVTDPEVSHRFSARRMERLVSHLARTMGDVDFFVSEGFGWRGGVVLAWSGMRGVITVAAAQSLPDDTPFRPEVVLIAFVVAGTTLLVQGLTLPSVIRALKIPGDDPVADQADYADLLAELAARAEVVLADPGLSRPGGRPYDSDVLDRVREAALARASLAGAAEPDTVSPREQYRHLMLRILAAERAELLAARSAGRYRSRTLSRAQRALDLMEATLQQIPDLADTES